MWQYKCGRKKIHREKNTERWKFSHQKKTHNIQSWKVYHHMEPCRQPNITDKVHTFRSTGETFISRKNYIVGNSKMPLSSPWGNHWKKMRDQCMLPAGCTADDCRELGLAHVCGTILFIPLASVHSSQCFYFHTLSSSARRTLTQFLHFYSANMVP